MLPRASLIVVAMVIYTTIDQHSCRSIGPDSHWLSHRPGNGVRTVNDDENRPTLYRPTTQPNPQMATTDRSMQYIHYAARSDDDNQYRDHDYDSDRFVAGTSPGGGRGGSGGVTGPVHTYIKTDKNANFKWGVRHFAGKRYGG